MILGALIVVAGAGFFLKLAYDEGWHRALSPALRCLLAAGFGGLLMGAGELARRKLGAFAAIGFSAAGLGVLYATAYAASGVFELVSVLTSFWMLVGVCALGLFTGVRARAQLLTVLALVGGYLTPIIMGDPDAAPWALPAYLLTLVVVGSGVSAFRPGQRFLTTIAWWGTSLIGSAWLLVNADEAPHTALAFAGLLWLVAQSTQGVFTTKRHLRTLWRELPVLASTGITLWTAGAVLFAVDHSTRIEAWAALLTLALACFGLGALFGRGVSFLVRPLDTVRKRTGMALVAQCGALLPLVVFLALDAPWAQSLVWASMALAALVVASRTRMTALAGYAVVLLVIASGRVLDLAPVGDPVGAAEQGFLGLVWTWWMALTACVGLVWIAGAFVAESLRTPDNDYVLRPARAILAGAGGVHLIVMLVHQNASFAGGVAGLVVLTLLALVVHARRATRPESSYAVIIGSATALFMWTLSYLTGAWDLPGQSPVLTNAMLWSALLAGTLLVTAKRVALPAAREARALVIAAPVLAGLVLLASTSVEASRLADAMFTDSTARAAALSLWWALVGVGAIVGGVLKRIAGLRYAGIGLLLVATAKVLTYDLVGLSPMARVASFIVVGLVLLVVATGYLRAAKRASDAEQSEEASEEAEAPTDSQT